MASSSKLILKAKTLAGKIMAFAAPPKPVLAVDMGTSAIKLIQLKKSQSGEVEIAVLHHFPLPPGMPADELEKVNFLGREYKHMLNSLKLKNPQAALSVSGSSVIVREAKLPALTPEEMERTLAFEAEPFIPYDIKEVNLDYHIIGETTEDGQQKCEVILIAAKKDLIESRLNAITAGGGRPIIVDVDAFALTNFMQQIPSTKDETVVVANIGASVTNLAIIERGTPKVVRDVAIGGNSFTQALQNTLNLDPESSEKSKRETGIIYEEEEKERLQAAGETQKLEISQTLGTVASDLVTEINKSIEFYLTHGAERSVQKIFLTGGGALLKNLSAYASTHLRLPAEILNPLDYMKPARTLAVNPQLGPAFTVACGLAMRNWNDWKKT